MTEDIDEICAKENARAVDLDREAAVKQRVSRIIYEYDGQLLDKTTDVIISVADKNWLGLPSAEEQRQKIVSQLQDYANILRERIKAYEESRKRR